MIKATPNGLAYDLLVQPGVDPSVIDLAYVGATELVIDVRGKPRRARVVKKPIYRKEQ